MEAESSQPLMNVQVFASPTQFMDQIKSIQYIQDTGLEELKATPVAIVYYGTPCCNIQCCLPCCCFNCSCDCGDNFIYHTLIPFGQQFKFLYQNIGRLDCKLCSTDPMSRFSYVKSLSLTNFNTEQKVERAEMLKEDNCVCCGCCSTFFRVNNKYNNSIAGFVRYKGCLDDCCKCKCECCFSCCCAICKPCDICFDYFYCCDILSIERQVVYTIFLRRCCLSCCPTDCFSSFTFIIKDPLGLEAGRIEMRRTCCTCCGLRGKNCTYTIHFPSTATPELKLTIINAVVSIDMFLF